MNTYYEILNLRKEASNKEIVKAYFHMVQKYPVERFSYEFMEITKAYEVLSNEKTRLEYDNVIHISSELKGKIDEAKELSKKGEFPKVIQILEELNDKFPNVLSLQSLLGEAYLDNENTGKGIKIFEKLVYLDANNASFIGHLGEAYLLRGWHKKAISQFEKSVELDEKNFSLWLGLSDAYTIANDERCSRDVFEKLIKKNNNLSANAYMTLFVIDVKEENISNIKNDLENLYNESVKNQNVKENIEWTLFLMSKIMINTQRFELAKEILKTAEKISEENEEIIKLKNNVNNLCELQKDISIFEKDKAFDDVFVYLIANKIIPDKSFEEEIYNRTSEYEFLINIDVYRKDIKLLSEKYPKIYEFLNGYFKKVSKREERIKMIKEHEKYLQSDKGKLDMKAVAIEDNEEFNEEVQETYIREEAKVGRNDPCPCGSGKKYKKCCGKQ